jgi:hypothetical protein
MTNQPLYESKTWGFKTVVFEDHIESKFWGETKIIAISNIASVTKELLDLRLHLHLNSGEDVELNPKDPKECMRIISELINNKNHVAKSSTNHLNDLEKLAELKEKGILTQEEFDAKKKLILGL